MDSAVWSDALRLKAWIHILLSANYKDKEWFRSGQIVKIRRGQFITSMRKLSLEWKCSRETVRRILEQFEELDMIRHEVVPGKYTVVTVVKYEDFQDSKNVYCDTDVTTDQSTDQSTGQSTDQSTDIARHKNNKNIQKKKKKEEPAAPSSAPEDEMWAWGGPKPKRWTEDDEWSWRNDQSNPQNPRMTRMEIWTEEWGESDD